MIYYLKNCRDGSEGTYETALEIKDKGSRVYFKFTAKNTQYYCPFHSYNDIHSMGDACEILIGTDPSRKQYYEIEISPENKLMIALMGYSEGDDGYPVLDIGFVEESFVDSKVTITDDGYIAELEFDKDRIRTDDGDIYFNAYRLETDGGEMDKHLFALVPTMRPKFHTPSYYVYLKDYADKEE